MRPTLHKLALAVLALLVGLSVVGTSASAEAKESGDIRFTKGPGKGAPPPTVHGVPVTPFAPDSRSTPRRSPTSGR